jgi:putative sugar O-methyltransferase
MPVPYDQGMVTTRQRFALRTLSRQLVSPLRTVIDRVNRRTSVTDERAYTDVCEQAARDPAVFATFRRHPAYVRALEHVTRDKGGEYLRIALEQVPAFVPLLERFRENDRLGGPKTYEYGEHGQFAPTTLRYVKVLSDLVTHFGSLDGFRIIEIGAGYGGQCAVTNVPFRPSSYALVDLEPCLALQNTYLSQLGVPNVRSMSADTLPTDGTYDLVVSNYAFSECVREVQEDYLARVLRRSSRGYLTCNWISPRGFRSLSPDELLEAIPGSRFVPEIPKTAEENRIWVWGLAEGAPEP